MSDKVHSRRSFLNHTLVNAGGIAAGQLIVLLATPVLARLYTPAEFGVYASLVAVCGVIATATALRFDKALPATQDDEIPSMYRLGLLACLASLVLGGFAVWLGVQHLLPWPQPLAPMALATLCVAAGGLQALMAVSGAVLVRRGAFLQLALQRMVQPACFVAAALLYVGGGLPAAFMVGLLAAALAGFAFSWPELLAPARMRAKAVARKYWEYPVVSLPMAVLDTLTLSLPLLFIVQHYGDAAGGNYSQVQRLAAAPLLLLSNAISQVFYKHAGDAARAGQSPRALMWRTVRDLALAGAAIIALVALAGEPVLSLFLGKGWRTDSHYLLLVLLPAVFRVCVSPITSIFLVMEQVRFGALWQMIYSAATWSVLGFASGRIPLDELLLAVLLNELALYGLYLWMADIAVRRGERKAIQCAA
ncbi:MAG TPA: oligosaccharide flippase family protein [Noviherbaspirillum sp.]|uniref:lipopolysaccharide biosynthesis protein n=1 Tax=Noviherbaspirillum sp. TaxID=1926288 RepID=UPI002B4898FA|nr:oligosaccharide flippase family protein [Noviherbaspirillum sp.]HJV84451.1 oligosaccharide flippase family protein [Noviherbaspirillum sp.]